MGVVIALDKKRNPQTSINRLLGLVKDDMEGLNRIIIEKSKSEVERIPEIAHHLIDSGGKRLRPILTIATAQMLGYQAKDHIKLAASVEFLHTATLLHDDVVDESDKRRGKQAARLIWGNLASVLVGDYLLGQAFKMMVEVGSLEALDILSSAAATIAEGEVLQIIIAKNTDTTEDKYLTVINAKTAALFSAAAEIGAVIGEANDTQKAAFKSYGKNLGIAFQLIDDALDYSGDEKSLGKAVGDDFREGKITLPIVLSYRRGNEAEREFWHRTIQNGELVDGDLEKAIALIKKHDAITDTIKRARHYGSMAIDALAIFPESEHKKALMETVEFCISRTH